ncbi:hypothetical protein EG329_011464 [Mollisiaceae sp. DMI_Dod_QoI]|nr:hypothetical protein EG329_011464 [Helotiales sp. DMI_Dod_QoI]
MARNDITFPRFCELPKELRDHIWELAVSAPRIVHLIREPLQPERRGIWQAWQGLWHNVDRHGDMTLSKFRSDCLAPSILVVCRESYQVASKFYTRAFPARYASGPAIYFDFARDDLYINGNTIGYKFGREIGQASNPMRTLEITSQLRKVQNLTLDISLVRRSGTYSTEEVLGDILGSFGGVELLTLSVELFYHSSWGTIGHTRDRSCLEFTDPGNYEWKPLRCSIILMDGTYDGEDVTIDSDQWQRLHSRIDVPTLEAYRIKRLHQGGRYWPLPDINYKIIRQASTRSSRLRQRLSL